MRAPLVVGFDLDMTLIDTRPGISATLQILGDELGVELPVDEIAAHLGPPLDVMLAPHLPAEQIPAAGDRFRALYPDHAVTNVPALPGAYDAIAAVREFGGSVLVVTGKYGPNAQRHIDHLGFEVDHLEGWVWGALKARPLREHGASIYVGDHVHDVEGAREAGVLSVSVPTGGCSAAELQKAGTDVVLDDLTAFGPWLRRHRETPATHTRAAR